MTYFELPLSTVTLAEYMGHHGYESLSPALQWKVMDNIVRRRSDGRTRCSGYCFIKKRFLHDVYVVSSSS